MGESEDRRRVWFLEREMIIPLVGKAKVVYHILIRMMYVYMVLKTGSCDVEPGPETDKFIEWVNNEYKRLFMGK